MRRLPSWLAGGPEVSTLAYQVVLVAFDDPPRRPTGNVALALGDGIGVGRVVAHLCDVLDADEADVLRAMAELERVGVLAKDAQ